jgi:hypothetical protein
MCGLRVALPSATSSLESPACYSGSSVAGLSALVVALLLY